MWRIICAEFWQRDDSLLSPILNDEKARVRTLCLFSPNVGGNYGIIELFCQSKKWDTNCEPFVQNGMKC